jgi:hypothetical protein
VLINRARNPSIFRRRFPIRLWNPGQHLLRQNPPPRSQFGSRRGCRRTGTARVACSSGPVLPLPTIRMTSGASATNSAAYLRMRSGSPALQRSSMRIEPSPELRIPNAAAQTRMVSVAKSRLDRRKSTRSTKPASASPLRSPSTKNPTSAAVESRRNPTTGIAGCCARAGSGHAATAPPSVARNFRRPMWLAMRPSGWGSFMQWRDDTTLPSRGQ